MKACSLACRLAGRVVLFLLLLLVAQSAEARRARSVILLIGDGMGPAQVELARQYRREIQGRPLAMMEIAREGRLGLSLTSAANALVTDSAAAATAMATGRKTNNGMVSVAPDGKRIETILELARKHGLRTGLVATSTITHATPACFASHVGSRGSEVEIAPQMLDARPDVLLGGGAAFFRPKAAGGRREDGRDLLAEASQRGYALCRTRSDLEAARRPLLLGLFDDGGLAPALGRPQSAPTQPSLVEMTRVALESLGASRRFFLMVEGSQIDWRCHASDAAGALHETLEFDDTVALAAGFARRHRDTLVLVTADHETGGMAFTGGKPQLEALSRAVASPASGDVKDGMTAPEIAALAAGRFGITLTEQEVQGVLAGAGTYRAATHGTALMRLVSAKFGVSWATGGHTALPVLLLGRGPGSEAIAPVQENTAVFHIMRRALGLK